MTNSTPSPDASLYACCMHCDDDPSNPDACDMLDDHLTPCMICPPVRADEKE